MKTKILFSILLFSSCKPWQTSDTESAKQTSAKNPADYRHMFELTSQILSHPKAKQFLRNTFRDGLQVDPTTQQLYGLPKEIQEVTSAQFIALLQRNKKRWPDAEEFVRAIPQLEAEKDSGPLHKSWAKTWANFLTNDDAKLQFSNQPSRLEALQFDLSGAKYSYSDAHLFSNYSTKQDNKVKPPADLKKVWMDFIAATKSQIVLNVFDFDLTEVADLLVDLAKKGRDVRVGIDSGVIKARPAVQKIFDTLNAASVGTKLRVFAVNSVGLNHQKIAARDYDSPEDAAVLLSSGNLTQSCIGPEGDLKGVNTTSFYSIPNANHVVTLKSFLLGQIVNYQLTLTLDKGLRGEQFPLSGIYRLQGKTPNTDVRIAFSPHGALGDINRDLIAQTIRSTTGRVRMLQFAFSAKEVEDALLDRAKAEIQRTGHFDFRSVGDTPFALRDWSVFLSMSGFVFDSDASGRWKYRDNETSSWHVAIPDAKVFQTFRDGIRVAPNNFGTHRVKTELGTMEVSAKLHHKVLLSGDTSIVGTSFNFSENALSNNEQIVLFRDPSITQEAEAMFDGLYKDSWRSVEEAALSRNGFTANDDDSKEAVED